MPKISNYNKVLIIGSGPNIIGSVAELDLMTKQAIDALVEENVSVVLVNPNPATVATDKRPGVTIYLEPLTLSFMKRILRMEEPDAIITAYGSLVGLDLTRKLMQDGILKEIGIELLTVSKKALELKQPSQQLAFCAENQLPTGRSWHLSKQHSLQDLLPQLTFPVLVTKYHRFVKNDHLRIKDAAQLQAYFAQEQRSEHFSLADYRLTEDLSDWEEVVVDLLRDQRGNFNFFNLAASLEPVGINSGDSVLVSPILDLNNDQVQRLRMLSRKLANLLAINGVLSVHFAVAHQEGHYLFKILGFKPRLARSSLMAYRTSCCSVGYLTAKLALGYSLDEIVDPQSGLNAAIEPTLDLVALKMPYWSFSAASSNHYQLGPRMLSSGEAISMGTNFSTAFCKGLQTTMDFAKAQQVFTRVVQAKPAAILQELQAPDEMHLVVLLAAFYRGLALSDIAAATKWQPIYLEKVQQLAALLRKIQQAPALTKDLALAAKKAGVSDRGLALVTGLPVKTVRTLLAEWQIQPAYLQVSGSAGLYAPKVKAAYSAYGVENQVATHASSQKILLLGLAPFQISQASEFDYMLYHACQTVKKAGYETVILSNNSEAISAAYDVADMVYCDPVTVENVLAVAKREGISKVLTEFSGKRVNSLRQDLLAVGLEVLGHEKYQLLRPQPSAAELQQLGLAQAPHIRTQDPQAAYAFAQKTAFPLLIGGTSQGKKQKSAVVFDMPALRKYIVENKVEHILISQFIDGQKYEITTLADGQRAVIPGIIEHLEQSGSHASDSIAVFKPQRLSAAHEALLRKAVITIAKELKLRGPLNFTFLIAKGRVYFLQLKTYAGHNLAFLSKATEHNIVALGTEVLLGRHLTEQELAPEFWAQTNDLIYIKMPVFSMLNYHSDNTFDSKMKNAGNVMGRDTALAKALYKGYAGAGLYIPSYGTIFISVKDKDKDHAIDLAKRFHRLGFKLLATEGTANIFAEAGITTDVVGKVHEGNDNLLTKIFDHQVKLVINVTDYSDAENQDAIRIRDRALSTHVPVFSSLQSAEYVLSVLESLALTTQPI